MIIIRKQKKRKGLIYCITNRINGKMYIGQTCNPLSVRRRQHIDTAQKGGHMSISCAIRKYGVENFTWTILEDDIPLHDLNRMEELYVDLFDTYNEGYNSTLGGDNPRLEEYEEYS